MHQSKKIGINVLFCGDIMPGGVLPYQDNYIDEKVRQYLFGFDFRVGTLECAIGTNIAPASEKLKTNGGNDNVCFARDEDFFRIKEMGFNAVSLGNNHSFDLGEEGLKNTMRMLKETGIAYFGAGMNKTEASAPLFVKLGGVILAVIGCCIKGLSPKSLIAATDKTYGVYQPSIEELVAQIQAIRDRCDCLIVMPHWGEEHVRIPPVKNVEYAKRMIDAGADGVLGSHSHCLAPHLRYRGKPIFYGLGNFLYPDMCLYPPRPFYYPNNSEELLSMPQCVNYPRSVSRPTLCVWGEDSRLGLIVEICLNETVDTEFRIVRMANDNVLQFYSTYSFVKDLFVRHIVMPITAIASKVPFYKFLYKLIYKYEIHMKKLGDFRKTVE